MGKSKDIQGLEESNAKFQEYLKQISTDLQTKSDQQVKMMATEIENYYKQNKWTSEKFIAGQNLDFMHSSTWSLDNVSEVINAIAGSIFGGSPAPKGTEVTPTPDIGNALAAMENLQLYLASRVFIALTGVLEAFGNSTSISYKSQYKSEALGNGFHLFTVMACNSYDSRGFFQNEKILEYLYAYEVRFSPGEAKSHAKIALIDALTDSINALAQKIKNASARWVKDELDDDQYTSLITKYKTIQDSLVDQLKDVTEENKQALRTLVAVPLITLDDNSGADAAHGMTKDYTQVHVHPVHGGGALLSDGHGAGSMKVFACGPFPANHRPVKGSSYNIQALEDGDQFPMDWDAKCTFSGETSQFEV